LRPTKQRYEVIIYGWIVFVIYWYNTMQIDITTK